MGMWIALLAVACDVLAKAPACKVDSDCTRGTVTGYCVESKCVECRTDDDCKLPKMCGQDHTCFDVH
jgi:hypothetical protein